MHSKLGKILGKRERYQMGQCLVKALGVRRRRWGSDSDEEASGLTGLTDRLREYTVKQSLYMWALLEAPDILEQQSFEELASWHRHPYTCKTLRSHLPAHLETLALDAIGQLAWQLCLMLIRATKNKDEMHQQKICEASRHIGRLLHETIPSGRLADEVTGKLLRIAGKVCEELGSLHDSRLIWCLREIVSLVALHPAVTELDLRSNWLLASPLLPPLPPSLRTLKLFHLPRHRHCSSSENFIANIVRGLPCLETFVFHMECTDGILTAVAKHCKRLRNLDLYGSEAVTDDSIGSVLKLKHLEQINVQQTGITCRGTTRLIGGLCKFPFPALLSGLCCNFLTASHLIILDKMFINLHKIGAESYEEDIPVFKTNARHLLQLSILKIGCTPFTKVKSLIQATGGHLSVLKLEFVHGLNITLIGLGCPSLQSLTVVDYEPLEPQVGWEERVIPPLAGFSSLKHLALNLHRDDDSNIGYILAQCAQVRVVVLIGGRKAENNSAVRNALVYNPMLHLERFSLESYMSGLLTLQTAMCLGSTCPKLELVRGLDSANSVKLLKQAFPHVCFSE